MYFEAYPLIFQGVYGMNAGTAALAFLPSMWISPEDDENPELTRLNLI